MTQLAERHVNTVLADDVVPGYIGLSLVATLLDTIAIPLVERLERLELELLSY